MVPKASVDPRLSEGAEATALLPILRDVRFEQLPQLDLGDLHEMLPKQLIPAADPLCIPPRRGFAERDV
jgi:hypothetical protein